MLGASRLTRDHVVVAPRDPLVSAVAPTPSSERSSTWFAFVRHHRRVVFRAAECDRASRGSRGRT